MEIAAASAEDVRHVVSNLRPEHRRELAGLSPLAPGDAARLTVNAAKTVFALKHGGQVLAVAGVGKTPLLSDAAPVWMLATPELDDHPVPAAAMLRDLFGTAHGMSGAAELEMIVPAWYRKGVKWLEWLGCDRAETLTIRGREHFRMIHRRITDVSYEPVPAFGGEE